MNKFLFYLLAFTWGLPMTLIGLIVALVLVIAGFKPKKYGYCIHFEVGEHWGGLELGVVFLTDKTSGIRTKNHELGHGIQNAILGPLFPFLVAIPSSIRYWLREYKTRKGKIGFSVLVHSIFLVIVAGLSVLAAFTMPWVAVFPVFVGAYSTLIFSWLLFKEIPQYDQGYVDYDAIWFEGDATRRGYKFFEDLGEEEQCQDISK